MTTVEQIQASTAVVTYASVTSTATLLLASATAAVPTSTTVASPFDWQSPFDAYTPTLGLCVAAIVLFSLTTGQYVILPCSSYFRRPEDTSMHGPAAHFIQAMQYRPRMWWILPTIVTCGIMEIVGWVGMAWGSNYNQLQTPFAIQ